MDHAGPGIGCHGRAAEVRHEARKGKGYIDTKYPKLRRLMTRGRGLPGTIMRWRRELEEAKQDAFLATFAQQMIDMEEEVKNISVARCQ